MKWSALFLLAFLATVVAGEVRIHSYPRGDLRVANVTGAPHTPPTIRCTDRGDWVDCQFFGLLPNMYVKDYKLTCKRTGGFLHQRPPVCEISYEVDVKSKVHFTSEESERFDIGELIIVVTLMYVLIFIVLMAILMATRSICRAVSFFIG